jgi:phosphatidylglycerol lysyltransferase
MSKWKTLIGSGLAIGLFSGALYVLNRELKNYKLEDIITSFRTIPATQVVESGIFCILSYVVLTLYDVLAIKYVGEKLKYYRIALASFIGYTFSHNLGFSVVTGGAARYRLFSSWGLTAPQIAQAIAFSGVTFWFGFALLAGIMFLIDPPMLPANLQTIYIPYQFIGIFLILIAVAYMLLGKFRQRPIVMGEFTFHLPKVSLTAVGLVVSAIDWLLAAAVAYTLLPPGKIGFWQFVGVFQAAQIIGLLSHIPGGAGVFEFLIITYYGDVLGPGELLGILLAYRVIYYIIPLSLSLLLFFSREIKYQWAALRPLIELFKLRVARFIPGFASVFSFLAGLVLLISGATPGITTRLAILDRVVPLPLLEVSHLSGSIVGLVLMILSRGLQRRLDSAYVLTLLLLVAGGTFSLLKGLDYEEAILLFILAAWIAPFRSAFYRKSAFLTDTFTPAWITMVIIVLVSIAWIVLFSYKHVEYSTELWWNFSLQGDAPRSLRSLVGISALFLFGAGIWIMRPIRARPDLPTSAEMDKVATLIPESPRTYASLALLGDKSFIFSESSKSFLMFAVEGRSWISFGDPVGPENESAELIWKLKELADEHAGSSAFYQVHSTYLPYYIDAGYELLKIGEEAIVDLKTFSISGNSNSGFRSAKNRAQKDGWKMEIIPASGIPAMLPVLRQISDSWMADKSTKEKGFSLGFFNERYLEASPIAVVKKEDKIVAFANLLTGSNKTELSVDLMRHTPDALQGIMDFLFVELLLWGKENGYAQFNMGMAPFSGLESHPLGPSWSKLGSMLYKHGEHFYNFQGVRKYKEKFKPDWQPRYLAAPGGFELARVVTNLATLISGGIKGLVTK